MGGGCCQLKRDKETELKTGAIDDKSAASDCSPEAELESRFIKSLDNFPFSSERIKVPTRTCYQLIG